MALMSRVHAAAPARLPKINPVSRPAAYALKTRWVCQSVHKNGLNGIGSLPIDSHPECRSRQRRTGQTGNSHARQDQEPAVPDNTLKAPQPLGIIPANPLLPLRSPPSGAADLKTTYRLRVRATCVDKAAHSLLAIHPYTKGNTRSSEHAWEQEAGNEVREGRRVLKSQKPVALRRHLHVQL